jgi:hypothetical protein
MTPFVVYRLGHDWYVGRPDALHLVAGEVTRNNLDETLATRGVTRADLSFATGALRAQFEAEFGPVGPAPASNTLDRD